MVTVKIVCANFHCGINIIGGNLEIMQISENRGNGLGELGSSTRMEMQWPISVEATEVVVTYHPCESVQIKVSSV